MPDYEKEGVREDEGGSTPIITPIKHSRLKEIAQRLGILKSQTESADPNTLVSEARNGHAPLGETTIVAGPEVPKQTVTIEGPVGQGRS